MKPGRNRTCTRVTANGIPLQEIKDDLKANEHISAPIFHPTVQEKSCGIIQTGPTYSRLLSASRLTVSLLVVSGKTHWLAKSESPNIQAKGAARPVLFWAFQVEPPGKNKHTAFLVLSTSSPPSPPSPPFPPLPPLPVEQPEKNKKTAGNKTKRSRFCFFFLSCPRGSAGSRPVRS